MSNEMWKDIPGYEGYYQVSNYGNVRSVDRTTCDGRHLHGKLMTLCNDLNGYKIINLSKGGVITKYRVHKLVALAFIDNPYGYDQINHIDEDKGNNCVENLEWCDVKYNINYGKRTILAAKALSGERSNFHKLTLQQVEEIRRRYKKRSKDANCVILGKEYGVEPSTIGKIVRNERWRQYIIE